MPHSLPQSSPPGPGALPAWQPTAEALSPRPDLALLADTFRRESRVRVPDFLMPGLAGRLHDRVATWPEWGLVTRLGGQHRVFDAAAMEALEPTRRADFAQLVNAEASSGFQYLYERYPLYERGRANALPDPVLREAHALLRSDGFLDLARRITGEPRIAFADGQLTRYRRGHFLTLHDDHAEGLGRIAAYVLNLTPSWAADFGGQLQFADAQGHAEAVVPPRFNLLTLFRVPSPHLVSVVAPFVAGARFAVTGWLREGPEPTGPAR